MTRDNILIEGQLEINIDRGVIYFHTNKGRTVLRISNVKIRDTFDPELDSLDVRQMEFGR